MDLLLNVRRTRRATLVLVTHDPALAALADTRLTLRDGRPVGEGPPEGGPHTGPPKGGPHEGRPHAGPPEGGPYDGGPDEGGPQGAVVQR